MKKLFLLAASAVLSSGLVNAQTQTISFETSEGYTMSSINGQKGWTVANLVGATYSIQLPTVVSTAATVGSNSLRVSPSGSATTDFISINKSVLSSYNTTGDIEVSFDINTEFGNSMTVFVHNTGTPDYSDQDAFTCYMSIGSGSFSGMTNNDTKAGNLSTGSWHNVKFRSNRTTNTFEYFIDNVSIGTGTRFCFL